MDILNTTARLWDMRRGDADDDRTSPHGRGWRNMVISSALEFNYLTASIAFLLLIIVPALLVGLAPPLFVLYGRRKLEAATQIFNRPFAAILSMTLLVAVTLWIARPLLSKAVDFFWHLHYTLVFPVFVGLREIISAVIEPGANRDTTPEHLDRRRRMATVLATLLLAGGGVAVALSVGFTSGRRLVEIADYRPWPLMRAALGNAALVLGVSTAVASVYWLVREVRSRRPILDWVPAPPASGAATLRVAHLSDLHLVGERYGYRMEAGTKGPHGNLRFRRTLRTLAAIHAATPLDRVLITGDITDAGTRAEWVEFLDLLRRAPELRARILFVPGNHDVNVIDRTNPGRFALPWSESHALRQLRVVLAFDAIQGESAHVVDRATGTPGLSLREYLREGDRPAHLRALAERGHWRGRLEMMHIWDAIFPLVVPPPKEGGYGVILLDSNAQRHFSLTNAVGVIGRSQLAALKSILRAGRDREWMILLHHHVAEYPTASSGLQERIGLALVNAPDVLAAIAAHGAPVLVLHGHRHRDWIGTRGDVVLCSAPSVALGAAGGSMSRGCFHVYELMFGDDGHMRLATSRQVLVA